MGGDPVAGLKRGLRQVPDKIQDRAFDRIVFEAAAATRGRNRRVGFPLRDFSLR
jgi:hypothetical protein